MQVKLMEDYELSTLLYALAEYIFSRDVEKLVDLENFAQEADTRPALFLSTHFHLWSVNHSMNATDIP